MAPTSDERREVAAKLRGLHDMVNPLYGTGDFQRQMRADIGSGAMLSDKAYIEALIDLIDPTCTVSETVDESDRDRYFQSYIYTCTACGASWTNFDNDGGGGWAVTRGGEFVDVRYCPYCGARIVEGDSDVQL